MYNSKKARRLAAFGLAAALALTTALVPSGDASAASAKKVKKVVLKIGKKKVTKKTYTLKKGKKETIKVVVTPSKAKKSVSFKSSKKSVATVTKKGKVTAKKAGTAKITVTVTGKNKKKKSTWVKIKVKAAGSGGTTATPTPGTGSATPTPPATATATPTPPATATATPTPPVAATPTPTPKPTPNYNNKPFEYKKEMNPVSTVDNETGEYIYGGDPAAFVEGDTLWLYTGHDVAADENYSIPEYLCYSTKDLKNWTYHGVVMKMTDVSWGDDNAAWAAQVTKYGDKYYMYFCSWDKTDSGKQSIGVAVADSPAGPFIDKGTPIVKGSATTDETSAWNDIDPTVWIEKDDKGVEHRYLAWGNGRYYICELNEDMVSVKDLDGDGKITMGAKADIRSQSPVSANYTEAPWLYRRKDKDGNPTGKYYLFYAYMFNEEMAYSTTDDLMSGSWKFGSVLTEPTSTSDTNHMSVVDFLGKTWFIYHNGALPGGSGHRRSVSIAEVTFNEDGSIQPIPETAAGPFGTKNKIYTSDKKAIAHEHYRNSNATADYPYTNVAVGTITKDVTEADQQWVMTPTFYKAASGEDTADYVSIQSENKQGLYLTATDDNRVVLAQNADTSTAKQQEMAKKQTFKKVAGLNDAADGVSYESVAKPGRYITVFEGKLYLTKGTHKTASTFYIDNPPTEEKTETGEFGTTAALANLEVEGFDTTAVNNDFKVAVPYTTASVSVTFTMQDPKCVMLIDGGMYEEDTTLEFPSSKGKVDIIVYAEDRVAKQEYSLIIEKDYSALTIGKKPVKIFDFEDSADGAAAVTKALKPEVVKNPAYSYKEGVNGGKAISLPGSYGMKLLDTKDVVGDTYSVSFWMKPTTLGGAVDPVLAGGTFDPQKWFNVTATSRGMWSHDNGTWIDSAAPSSYFTVGEWQQVVLTVDGSKPGKNNAGGDNAATSLAKLYLNGELVQTGQVAKSALSSDEAALYFGVNGWDAYFNGAVDEIMVFDRVLSEDEIFAVADHYITAKTTFAEQ